MSDKPSWSETPEKIDAELRETIWRKTDGRCWYCGCNLEIKAIRSDVVNVPMGNQFCVDHVFPRVRGGTNHPDNLVPVCRACNAAKKHKTVEEYRYWLQWKDIGRFSDSQIEWLRSHGIELPEPPEVVFFFESEAAL